MELFEAIYEKGDCRRRRLYIFAISEEDAAGEAAMRTTDGEALIELGVTRIMRDTSSCAVVTKALKELPLERVWEEEDAKKGAEIVKKAGSWDGSAIGDPPLWELEAAYRSIFRYAEMDELLDESAEACEKENEPFRFEDWIVAAAERCGLEI